MQSSSGIETSFASAGRAAFNFARELFPLCRSLTGDGVRETLRLIAKRIPLQINEIESGRSVLDWEVPLEWNIRSAWLKDPSGRIVCDFRDSNLHVLGYSKPIAARLGWSELEPHLFSLPDRPDQIPYLTSFYQENWGFCLADSVLQALPREGCYEAHIDATLAPGSLSYGEAFIPGDEHKEILISTHTCHPSLANDNLSGIAVATGLCELLSQGRRRFSYRFLFLPATIGPIVWLSENEPLLSRVWSGLVLSGLGDAGPFTYKRSRRGDAPIDGVVTHLLRPGSQFAGRVEPFSPFGYDERQYCSPGFNLPMGRLSRTPFGTYPEYHTSADDLGFISADALGEACELALEICNDLERDRRYRNLSPKGEPQLGRRGLYGAIGGRVDKRQSEQDLLWVLNYSDSKHGLLEIASKANVPLSRLARAAELLAAAGLLEEL